MVAPMEDPNPQTTAGDSLVCETQVSKWSWPRDYAARATEMNEPFIHFMRTGRPLVTLKSAVTLDGKIAAPEDNAGWITSETARAHVQTLRHRSDAILTGIGTVLADDCRLTDRSGGERSRPLLADRARFAAAPAVGIAPGHIVSNDVLVVTTSAASPETAERLERMGVRVEVLERSDGRASLQGA